MHKKAVMVSYMLSLNVIRAMYQKGLGLESGIPVFESQFHHCVPLGKLLNVCEAQFSYL